MVETLTSAGGVSSGGRTMTDKSRTSAMSSASVVSQQGKWTVRKVETFPEKWEYTTADFIRGDESSDTEFYKTARFVTHIDDQAIEKLTEYYTSLLPSTPSTPTTPSALPSHVLDLCGSWISHLPLPLPPTVKVFGLGLNAAELSRNEAYNDGWRVFDLNAREEERWEFLGEKKFDVIVCTVSVDYLVYPLAVLRECFARLKDAGTIHLAISNRCFPTKAIALWLRLGESARLELIAQYLHFSGFVEIEVVEVAKGGDGGRWEGDWGSSDPVWVVRGRKISQGSEGGGHAAADGDAKE